MKKISLMSVGFLAIFVMTASIAGAAPTCASLVTSGAVDVAVGGLLANSIGCTADGLLFSNFQYLVAGGSGSAVIDLTQNGVSIAGDEVSLNFNPNLGPPSLITDLHFTFTVTGFIYGADMQNAGLLSSIQEMNCTGTETLNGVCSGGSVIWNTSDADNQFSSCIGNTASGTGTTSVCAYGSGVRAVSVWKDITLMNVNGHLTSFTESFAIPEPVTLSLMGIGLLGIGLLGRRRLQK